jgi:phage replication-related protein YjqB (UPF0714/DUF867 family)
MANQQCNPPRLARREFLLGLGAAVPLVAQGCGSEAEFDQFRDLPNPQYNFFPLPPAPMNKAVNVTSALQNQSFKNDDQSCSVSKSLGGILVGDQVRIVRNPDEYAIYTVEDRVVGDNVEVVRMGTSGRERLGTSNSFEGMLIKPVVASNMTDEEAEAKDEFVERLVDDGSYTGLCVIAPHGGGIERGSDRQAEAVTQALGCSSWILKGWKSGGGTSDRWHVTSTKISPRSFPGLGLIAKRGFAYSVSFHGMAAAGVLIGGAGPNDLKQMLRDAILDELSDPDIDVVIAEEGDANSGMSEKNVVNWLTDEGIGGIQLEQSMKVRMEHWQEVVDAVISVYSQLI